MLYFDIHVFLNRHESFSVFLKANMDELPDNYDDDDVIDLAVEKEILNQSDADMVDYVEEIDEQEYNDAAMTSD